LALRGSTIFNSSSAFNAMSLAVFVAAEVGDLSQFNTSKAAATVSWGRALPRRVDQNLAHDLSADRKEMSPALLGDILNVY
jgi:hypothetical protein